jgi:hypothetical protein
MALGPENFQIESGPIYYVDGVEVTPGYPVEVDPAVTHTVGAKYKVRNNGAGITHWWEMCLTVYDVTHGIAKGSANDHGSGGVSDWKERHINVGYISEDTAFRVRVWANQDYGASPPPESEW